jgi:uncharacterized GH25 family protein
MPESIQKTVYAMKKRNWILSLVVPAVVLTVSSAHEFWIQPEKFYYNAGDRASLRFMVGENLLGEPWDLKQHRIVKLEHRHMEGRRDVLTQVRDDVKENLSITLTSPGTHMILLQSNNAFISLEAEQFNAYLNEDGLDNVLAVRKKNNEMTKPGTEFYSRYAKLLLQAGDNPDRTYQQVVGFPLEIIPDENPYELQRGDPIHFTVLFDGKPMFGAKVRIWNRHDNRTTVQNIYTEKNGKVETHISNPGTWMASVVTMVPSTAPGAEWQSYWASLVFGAK